MAVECHRANYRVGMSVGSFVVAIWSYSMTEDNELDFEAGDVIKIVELDEGWCVRLQSKTLCILQLSNLQNVSI